MLKRILAVLATATLAIGLALGAATPASAHTPSVTATCSTLTVKMDSYGSNTANQLKVSIDGNVVENTTFANAFAQKVYTFSGTVAHTYVVEVDAQDNGWDRTVAKGTAITGTTTPCTTAQCTNPLTALNNFTIVTEGNLTVNNQGAHAEGTAAVGGDLIVSQQYHVTNNKDGSALPVVEGKTTGLLVGGKVTLNASDAAFKVLAGATRVGTTTGAEIKESNRYLPVIGQHRYIQMSANATLPEVTASGLFAATFPNLFANLRASSAAISNYSGTDVNLVTAVAHGNDGKEVVLSAGVTNVLRVSASDLAAITKLWFAGAVVPSATTPFIIDVTSSSSPATVPVIQNVDPRYVLWNFSKVTGTLSISTSTGADFVMGSVLVPNGQLSLVAGGIEGQIAAKSMVITSAAEIHHYKYSPCATPPTSVTGAATATAEYCDTTLYVVQQGSVTATVKTGVIYQLWNADKSTKIADLVAGTAYQVDDGTYYVKVLASSSAYSVSTANTWIQVVVAASTADCTAPTPVSGAATATAEICDANYDVKNGSVTATVKAGVTYQLWSADKSTKIADLTAGSPYSIANGTYYVKVLPATVKYQVASANEWIQVSVGKYTGVCAQDVSGSASAAPESCDSTVYEVKDGAVTANAANGVTYELWNAAKTTKIADLVAGTPYPIADGTYFVKVLPATAKFTVSAGGQWIQTVVGAYTGDCTQGVAGSASASAESCDTDYEVKNGSVTANAATGVTYELWNAAKSTKIADLTAGTAYSIANGTYFVKVLPATAKFSVTPDNTWIQVVVGAYTGECDEPVSGSAAPTAETCDTTDYEVAQGAVTANVASNVTYELWNAAKSTKIADLTAGTAYRVDGGTYYVKVLPATGDHTVLPADEWIQVVVGKYTGICALDVSGSATPNAEYCDTDYAVKQGSVTANLTTGVTYELWNAAKTTKLADLTAGTAYKVDGGTYFVKVLPATDKYDVSARNTWLEVVVGAYTGECDEPVSGSASGVAEVCDVDDYVVEKGSVTAAAATGVVYELWNSAKDTKIATLTAGTAYPVAGGTYFVKVLPATGDYTVPPADEWIQVDVAKNTTVCQVIGDPVKFEGCVVNPQDLNDSNWTASLTIVAVDHVRYRVFFSNGTTFVDQGLWAAGTYAAGTAAFPFGTLVKVVAEPETGWNLLAPKSWTYPFAKGYDCDLSTNGVVDPTVVFAQTCVAGPTYTLGIDGGLTGSVLWSVNGGPATTQLGTFPTTAGSTVKIVATPAPGMGFTGAGQTALQRSFEKTFTTGAECDLETLAFTGQNVTGYLVIAIILFQAGLALVAVQFIRARRKARHLAV